MKRAYRNVANGATVEKMMLPDYEPSPYQEAFDREDYQSALQLALPYANAGNSVAQRTVAILYETGLGVERDVLEAERWLLKATAQNDPVAWHNLGTMYATKHSELEHRWSDARKCWKKAKELGFNLAEPYPPPSE